ncbi:hypothetical protein FAF44_50725 [Nonomuraea sp. MG754425]|uniref:AAA family ATPase n=1 Tax=Nonomuraea sp. MG754425 TaxID=2570319 RepID=UPI001F28FA23|nr:AAA family ATPase [Nonomuraea sp. MG754425]MCF6476553.1 hypothetical protein [Nonomuraea sp. MG754425]
MIVGRARESALIEDFLRPRRPGRPGALLVRGDAGLGKSALIEDVLRSWPGTTTVLRARGYQGETALPYAVLHQLLRPLLGGLDALPPPERAALRAAFAMDGGGARPDRAAVAPAALALLSALGGVLLLVDDAQWGDPASLEVAGFAARGSRQVTVLAATRGRVPSPLAADAAELRLGPLPAEAAGTLLGLQPGTPPEPLARLLLREAGGNPLAIIELAKAARSWTGAAYGPGEPLPLTERLDRLYAGQLAQLPRAARDLVVTLAAACDDEWPAVLTSLTAPPGTPAGTPTHTPTDGTADGAVGGLAGALVAAAEAGLLTLPGEGEGAGGSGGVGPGFRYPLIRSAVSRAVSFEERRRAHLRLARALEHDPDRRARHLASAADGADEEVAALLEAAGDRAGRRGALAEALTTHERAARLTPGPRDRAARLVKAARSALYLEQAAKVEELAASVTALTDDPGVLALLPPLVGWVVSSSGRQDAAMALLIPAAEAAAGHAPSAAARRSNASGRPPAATSPPA